MIVSRQQLMFILVVATSLAGCNKDDILESDDNFRAPNEQSLPFAARVYEYMPAPGQFINDPAGMDCLTTMDEACRWAEQRLDNRLYVSLGGFGGYIIVGFDHSIRSSKGGYDFGVAGNAFFNAGSGEGGSNEPGIVWVMQDANGNGLPDDIWYELQGSDSADAETNQEYAVTYYRPTSSQEDVRWVDNEGNSGIVPYLAMFHKQDSYYPAWVKADEYTLSGTLLKDRMYQQNNTWNLGNFEWGYADNMGADNAAVGDYPQCNRFRISDARTADRTPANLDFIDFVKVQTAVCAHNSLLGEASTEVIGVIDLSLYK